MDGTAERGAKRLVSRPYVAAALACASIAVVGFARTYYLKVLYGGPSLPFSLHVHGIIMSSWCALLLLQTVLIARHRVDLHRRLGVVGAVLGILVVTVGVYATVEAAAREVRAHIVGRFHFLLGLNLVNLFLFAIFLGGGLVFRKRPAFHKRLMLLATVSMLAPAIARIVTSFTHKPLPQLIAFDLSVLAFVAIDTIRHRRLHPVFGWGALFILVCFDLTFFGVQTKAWLNLVPRLFS
jgi:hypothetical protein